MKDHLIENFQNEDFQAAFRQYFAELGINVRRWDALFAEMDRDPHGPNCAYLRMDGDAVVGFIQFAPMEVKSWFFEAKAGFIREFWVAQDYRGQGHGGALLALAEARLRDAGAVAALLTTDTAAGFYERRGYVRLEGVAARNGMPVYGKGLSSPPIDNPPLSGVQ